MTKTAIQLMVAMALATCSTNAYAESGTGVAVKDPAKQPGVVTSFVVNGFHQPLQNSRDRAQSVGSVQVNFVPLGKGNDTIGGVELDFQDLSQEPRMLADSYATPGGLIHIILPASQMASIYRFLELNVPFSTAQVNLGFVFNDKHELEIKQSTFELYTTGAHGPLQQLPDRIPGK